MTRLGVVKGGANERPLNRGWHLLTEDERVDTLRRRAGRDARPQDKVTKHADAHKYCPLGRCGSRAGPYQGGYSPVHPKTQRIIAWRKAKAAKNRAYLEEHVYATSS